MPGGLIVKPVSQEPNVRAALSKVELGEADAALVYKTDAALAMGKVDAAEIPNDQNAIASYPAASLKASKNPAGAAAFVAWLQSPKRSRSCRGRIPPPQPALWDAPGRPGTAPGGVTPDRSGLTGPPACG